MSNDTFFETIFPADFWPDHDNGLTVTDEHSMFDGTSLFDWLIRTVRPQFLIEIGSWKGHSANYMIDRCKEAGLDSKIVCVDTFLGGPEHWVLPGGIETLHRRLGRPTVLERFLGNTLARGNKGNVFPLTIDSYGAAHIFRHFGFKADLIFVDGGHDPATARNDIMEYYPLLSERGVMFGDDYQYPPLAETLHACAAELGLQVIVSERKWVLVNEALMQKLVLPNVQVRTSFEGWVHP